MNLLPSPTRQREISIMLELGFLIDNFTIKRVCHLSNDSILNAELLGYLDAIGKITLARTSVLQDTESCF